MGLFKRIFKRKENPSKDKNEINQGIGYMYMIMGLQVVFVLVILFVMLFIGKVIATPWWVFSAMFLSGVGGCVYLYKKAKRKWNAFKTAVQNFDLSDKNYEISIMGGMLTMRVEQNPHKMLETSSLKEPQPLPPPSGEETTGDETSPPVK